VKFEVKGYGNHAMKTPQFAERQYETAANNELSLGRGSSFVPSQPLEAFLGIDAAANPLNAHAIWRILSVQVPRRVQLSPLLWPGLPHRFHDEIPGRVCSLFMQFKRPVFQDHARAKHYKTLGQPYFEVKITPHQQAILLQLEERVTRHAVVRYASPAFWSREDFDSHDTNQKILPNSAFISASQVKDHKKWIYTGPSGKVLLNPTYEETYSEGWEGIVNELTENATRQSVREHIRSIASLIGEDESEREIPPERIWLNRLDGYGRFSSEDKKLLLALSNIALAADRADAIWLVMILPDDDWRDLLTAGRRWPYWWI
jgi:hypothetical protein